METKQISIEMLHSWMRGDGAKYGKDGLRDVRRQINNYNRRMRDGAMRDLGLKKVRGNLGGTYWE